MAEAMDAETVALAVANARERLAPYEIDCLVDFSGVERRDVQWGAAMSEAVSSLVSMQLLTRGPNHRVTHLGAAVANVLAKETHEKGST